MLWQPTLLGKTLRLRPLTLDDFEPLYQAASDPLIWEVHPEPTRYQRAVFQKFFDSGIKCQGALAILDQTTGAIIGSSRFTDHSPEHASVEIGYTFLKRPYWGGSTNQELKTLMLEHAFLHVETAYFVVGTQNHRSRRAMEKIGGTLLQKNEGLPLSGDLSRSVVYEIRRSTLRLHTQLSAKK